MVCVLCRAQTPFDTSTGRIFDRPIGRLVPPFQIGNTSSTHYLARGWRSTLACMNHPLAVVLGLPQGQQVAGLRIFGEVGHDWGIC